MSSECSPGFLKVLGDDALQNDMTSSASDDLMTIRHRKLDHSVSVFFFVESPVFVSASSIKCVQAFRLSLYTLGAMTGGRICRA